MMRRPQSMWSLETLGRVKLSKYFYMREFLYSEIANINGLQNIPDDPDLAVAMGGRFVVRCLTRWRRRLAEWRCVRGIVRRRSIGLEMKTS